MRAAGYIRVSTPRQAEDDKISLNEQERRFREHCRSKSHTITTIYSDVASGATKKRPGFQQMLRDAQAGKADVIVAWKADRLARGISPCAALYEALENTNITIETIAEPFDRTTFEIRAILGRIELENIGQRTQMGREGRIKEGKHHAHPPFGYDYDKSSKCWIVNKYESKWVKQIFDWYIDSISVYEIARRLNNAGVPTKMRSRLGWTAQKVSELVNSEYYTGVAYYNKRQGITNKPKERSQWIVMSVPAIIDSETWQAAKAKRQNNKKFSPRNTKMVYLTQHILVCQECDKRFLVRSSKGQARLVCRGMTYHPHLYNCRNPKSIKYQPIADRLWEGVKGVLESEGGLQAAIQSRVEYVKKERQAIRGQIEELSRNLVRLKDEKDIVITGFRKGFYDENGLQRQLEAIKEDEQRYIREIDSLLADMSLQDDAQAVYQQAKRLMPIMQKRLNTNLNDSEKHEIIKLLIGRALLNSSGDLTIEFTVPSPSCFSYATSPHAGLHDYKQGPDGVDELANHWS